MSRRIVKSAAARADLIAHFAHIGEDSVAVAEQFLTNAEATFAQLLMNPRIGRPWRPTVARHKGLRIWPVAGFRNYLVFYRPVDDGVQIYRVLHGARDLGAALLE